MEQAFQALVVIVLGVGGCIGYFYLSNLLLDRVLFPARGPNMGRNINRASMIRPWLFLFPAIFALGLYLAYPVVATAWMSLNKDGEFVGLQNYSQMVSEPKFWESMHNNVLWLIVVPALSTAFGLLAAQLTDRIRWGNIAKSLIFMPMAISFVGASVIWKLIYDTRPVDQAQIGLLNALWLKFEGGFGSTIGLRVIPAVLVTLLILAFAYAAWSIARPLLKAGAKPRPVALTAHVQEWCRSHHGERLQRGDVSRPGKDRGYSDGGLRAEHQPHEHSQQSDDVREQSCGLRARQSAGGGSQ